MKKSFLILLIMSCISLKMLGQSIFVGDTKYSSTPTWKFVINGETWSGDLEVAIAKTDFGGYLWLATEFPQNISCYIGGNVTIYLEDETTISCIYRNIRDNVDNKAITLYKLTTSEIETLKTKRIITIRFQIIGFPWSGTKTADNKIYGINELTYKNSYLTESDVKTLFK
jgi:hypothetical protein